MNFVKWFRSESHRDKYEADHPAFLAAREAWDASKKEREWVGLTTDDLATCILKSKGDEVTAWKCLEAKLKEKNT